ncbi:MAG: AAA family ATPase [Blautia sp.]|nr:AAA family ATPase [Blautia sp.]
MNHIVIIGFMGAGKTKVGKRLAKDLGLPYVDLDKLIVSKMKMPISELFKRFGEPFYRATETFIVKALIDDPERKVITLGSGCPVQPQNEEYIPKLGTVVYLKGSPEVIIERIKEKDGNPIEREETTEERLIRKIETRNPIYSGISTFSVNIANTSLDDLVAKIEKKISDIEKKELKKAHK